MKRKEILEKRLARLTDKVKSLEERALASNDVAEVRALNEQIKDVNFDIAEVRDEIAEIEAEEARSKDMTPPANAELRNGSIVESFKTRAADSANENVLASTEYRNAFKAYVQNGTEIPAEFRAGVAISTEDTGAAIPETVMNEVIYTVRKRYGNLYNKVRHLNVKGGVKFPIGALQATFKWVNEATVSPRQKLDPLARISFDYHLAEIRVAQTFVSQIVTLEAFEAEIAKAIAVAYLQAMDYAIVNGSGDGAPLGILNDPRVAALGQTITLTAAEFSDWTAWKKKVIAKMPLGYRNGEWIFNIGTVDSYLETMADSNGRPIFREATGLEMGSGDSTDPRGRFFGREVAVVEPDILPDYDTASANDIVGIFWQPEEYAFNENFAFAMRRYFDEETNEFVNKALVVTDGKVLNPTGFILIKKG